MQICISYKKTYTLAVEEDENKSTAKQNPQPQVQAQTQPVIQATQSTDREVAMIGPGAAVNPKKVPTAQQNLGPGAAANPNKVPMGQQNPQQKVTTPGAKGKDGRDCNIF